jgi:hypothetical protein
MADFNKACDTCHVALTSLLGVDGSTIDAPTGLIVMPLEADYIQRYYGLQVPLAVEQGTCKAPFVVSLSNHAPSIYLTSVSHSSVSRV